MAHAHTPPFTKPTGASNARKLYDETSDIAAAQDANARIKKLESRVDTLERRADITDYSNPVSIVMGALQSFAPTPGNDSTSTEED